MTIITSVGYYGTGSGAVTDFLKEFDNVSLAGHGEYEIRFIQDPDGISDLYYNLIENNHRHNTSNAIKRFIKYIKYLNGSFYTKRYRRFFGNDFKRLSMKYIDKITQLKSLCWCHLDQINRGQLFVFFDICYGTLLKKIKGAGERQSILQNKEYGYFSAISETEFLNYTKEYLNDLFESANVNKTDFVVAEQLIPPSNINRYVRFFKDIKVIVVDRDPRDVYIQNKEIYRGRIIPWKTPEEFCEWFRIIRKHRETENFSKALFLRFEDLVYKYDETTKKIIDYIGLNEIDHNAKFKYFDPSVSKQGTKLFEKYPKYMKETMYIEQQLKEFLYPYEKI